jgi:hypothetical protein
VRAGCSHGHASTGEQLQLQLLLLLLLLLLAVVVVVVVQQPVSMQPAVGSHNWDAHTPPQAGPPVSPGSPLLLRQVGLCVCQLALQRLHLMVDFR